MRALFGYYYYVHHSFIHSFHCQIQNARIPCQSQRLHPFLPVIYPFPPTNLPSSLTSSCHLFLVYLSALLFPKSYIILFWEFYFPPFSVQAQTNVIYLTLLSVIMGFLCHVWVMSTTFLGILFSSLLCTSPKQCNLFNLTVSVIMGFLCHVWVMSTTARKKNYITHKHC